MKEDLKFLVVSSSIIMIGLIIKLLKKINLNYENSIVKVQTAKSLKTLADDSINFIIVEWNDSESPDSMKLINSNDKLNKLPILFLFKDREERKWANEELENGVSAYIYEESLSPQNLKKKIEEMLKPQLV